MPRHIAFLRAVNVGKRQVRMAELRQWLTEEGFTDVDTYIQTGNVRVGTPARSPAKVARALEDLLLARCGFDVTCVMVTPTELTAVHDLALGLGLLPGNGIRKYVTFLREDPPDDVVAEINGFETPGERALVVGRAVHWWIDKTSHEARLSNARLERSLGPGTTRDLKVVAALRDRWGA